MEHMSTCLLAVVVNHCRVVANMSLRGHICGASAQYCVAFLLILCLWTMKTEQLSRLNMLYRYVGNPSYIFSSGKRWTNYPNWNQAANHTVLTHLCQLMGKILSCLLAINPSSGFKKNSSSFLFLTVAAASWGYGWESGGGEEEAKRWETPQMDLRRWQWQMGSYKKIFWGLIKMTLSAKTLGLVAVHVVISAHLAYLSSLVWGW